MTIAEQLKKMADQGYVELDWQLTMLDAAEKLEEYQALLTEISNAPGLGASHPQFSRYFLIPEELATRIKNTTK